MISWTAIRADGTTFVVQAPDALNANLKALANNHSDSPVVKVEQIK